MQTINLSSPGKYGQMLNTTTPMRLRAFRFLSERYAQRERPSVAAEFVLFALIVLISTWPIVTLVHVMSLRR
jgi:hypothetical protein